MRVLSDLVTMYSGGELLLFAYFVSVAAAFFGYIADCVLRDRGFGPIGNGVVMVLGWLVALMTWSAQVAPIQYLDGVRGLVLMCSAGTIALLLGGLFKRVAFRSE